MVVDAQHQPCHSERSEAESRNLKHALSLVEGSTNTDHTPTTNSNKLLTITTHVPYHHIEALMTTTTQQIPSNPALDFANAVLAETDGGREIVLMLHDIAQGVRENATTQDRINATNILMDRGLGKCPKQAPATRSNPNPAPEPNDVEPAPYSIRGAIRESPSAVPHKEPASPRLVTQFDDSLHQSFGPPPEAKSPTPVRDENTESLEPFDPYSIQKHILEITNNCLTLMTVLTDIYRAPDDDPKACPEHVEGACPEHEPALSLSKGRRVKDSHRVRAGRMLVDRITAMYPTAVLSAADGLVLSADYPEHSQSACPEPGRRVQDDDDEPFDKEVWDGIFAELKQLEEDGVITPDPNAPKHDFSNYLNATDEEVAPYADEEAAKFEAEIKLRLERQKNWPEIEERRRKKLAQIYPSHSEDDKPPDT